MYGQYSFVASCDTTCTSAMPRSSIMSKIIVLLPMYWNTRPTVASVILSFEEISNATYTGFEVSRLKVVMRPCFSICSTPWYTRPELTVVKST